MVSLLLLFDGVVCGRLYKYEIRILIILHNLLSVVVLLVIVLYIHSSFFILDEITLLCLWLDSFRKLNFWRYFKIKVAFRVRGHVTPVFTGIRRNMENTAGSSPQSNGFTEKLKAWLSWSWTYVCFIWFGMVMIMIYVLWSPLKLQETLASGE